MLKIMFTFFLVASARADSFTKSDRFLLLDRLEHQLADAYENTQPGAEDAFELAFDNLVEMYAHLHYRQELAWTHMRYGNDAEGQAIEDELARELATDPVVRYESVGRGILRLHLMSGLVADFSPEMKPMLIYKFSRYAGLNLVPTTAVRTFDGCKGTAQLVLGDRIYDGGDLRYSAYPDKDLQILDYITGQLGRDKKSWYHRPGGFAVAERSTLPFGIAGYQMIMSASLKPAVAQPKNLSVTQIQGLRRLMLRLEDHAKNFREIVWSDFRYFALKIHTLAGPKCAEPLADPLPQKRNPTFAE